jgi:predicted small secreted protein
MMKKKQGIFFGIAVLLIVIFTLTACDNPAGGVLGGDDDVPNSPIGIWTGTWTGNTSSSIELKITSNKYNFSGMGTRDEGTWSQSGDRITFISTMETGEFGWAKITGNTMTFNVTMPFFVGLFNCTGGQLTKTGSIDPLPSAKTIVISGFPGNTYSGNIAILTLWDSFDDDDDDPAAMGWVSITSASSITIPLKTDDSLETNWTGTGSYILLLAVCDDEGEIIKMFAYTNGIKPNASGTNIPTCSITQATTTLAFDTFWDVTDLL